MIFPSLLFLKIFPFPIIEYWCHLQFHGLRTPNEGINPWNLKIWANLAVKICFDHTYKFGIGIWFLAVQWRRFPHRVSIVRVHFDWFTGWWEIRNSAKKNLPIICKSDNRQLVFFFIVSKLTSSIFLVFICKKYSKNALRSTLIVPLIDRNFFLRVIPSWNTYDQFWFLFSCLFLF